MLLDHTGTMRPAQIAGAAAQGQNHGGAWQPTDQETPLSSTRVVFDYAQLPKQSISCPICASTGFEVLSRADRYRMGVCTAQCAKCGLVMTNPMPTADALNAFYKSTYRVYYRKVQSPSAEHILELGLGVRAEYTAGVLQAQGLITQGSAILDVGCAEGSLLRAIASRCAGTLRVGVEPNPHFAAFAERWAGACVHDDLSAAAKVVADYDLIIVNHVLEHVRDPVAFLSHLGTLLKPEGVIYIDVPDATRYGSLADLHIAHLFHFTPASLRNLAGAAGLMAALVERHDPPRHPQSLRAILRRGPQAVATHDDPDAAAVRRRVRRIDRFAPWYFVRRSLPARLLLGVPARLWRVLKA
jgi:SAM-dependent methyltransferase